MHRIFLVPVLCLLFGGSALAELKLPAIISDHMVLQRDEPVTVWGWADEGDEILVAFAGQVKKTTTGKDGTWKLDLDAMPASASGRSMTIAGGSDNIVIKDILVGEVWVCSGQSNMEWTLSRASDSRLEIAAANYPLIRHAKFPHIATPEPQADVPTAWTLCSSETAANYTAVGYFFGRNLHQVLNVPIGLVNTSWGGTPSEAWTRPGAIEAVDNLKPLMKRWNDNIDKFDQKKVDEAYEKAMKKFKADKKKFEEEQAKKPEKERKKWTKRAPSKARNPATAHHRPGNIYNGMIHPILNLTFKGAIWYQGESNQGRAHQYRTLFPLMIDSWRKDFDNGEFPFYFVQIADFRPEVDEPPAQSSWAEVREAQDLTLNKLKKTGQAVIIDIGMGTDIHPPNKQEVGDRLSRLALHHDYGKTEIIPHGPRYKSHEIKGDKVLVSFDVFGSSLKVYDRDPLAGFAIAGEDKKWHWADAKTVGGDKVEVWHKDVKKPVAVRYAWADNPVCNLFNREDLPTAPFRTDDWEMMTKDAF